MAGSHFTTLWVLEQVLPKAHIRTVHTGGPGQRLLALLQGEVEAATLLDPEIAIAEAKGLRDLARGEFLITFWVAPTVNQNMLQAYFRALKRADEALARDPEHYMPSIMRTSSEWSGRVRPGNWLGTVLRGMLQALN